MRLAIVIVALAGIGVALVHIRRGEIVARHETRRLQSRQETLRRRLAFQKVTLGRLISPGGVRRRTDDMSLGMDQGPRTGQRDLTRGAR